MKRLPRLLAAAFLVAAGVWLGGCASTTGAGGAYGGPPPIPEGMGRIWLEAGGINELNFYITDQETDEEVYSDTPRLGAGSPVAYESGSQVNRLRADLTPGLYTIIVNTDIDDRVEVRDVELGLGEEKYIPVPVGRFTVRVTDNSGPLQVPFLISDYGMRAVLGKGMTSTMVRHFIVPAGRVYKISIENLPAGVHEIRPLEVTYGGSPTQIEIDLRTQTTEQAAPGESP
ncbi:MAG: hypothetical protein ABIL09_01610 [Gemmatimonadota bacterium]